VATARASARSIAPSPTTEEAAAIVVAIERFMRATATQPAPAPEGSEEWRDAAILEGVDRELRGDVPDPWINT
jgi:hypothetical protein